MNYDAQNHELKTKTKKVVKRRFCGSHNKDRHANKRTSCEDKRPVFTQCLKKENPTSQLVQVRPAVLNLGFMYRFQGVRQIAWEKKLQPTIFTNLQLKFGCPFNNECGQQSKLWPRGNKNIC